MNHRLSSSHWKKFLPGLLLAILAAVLPAHAQNVGFTADATSGCAPLTVSFTNNSDNGATAYDWNFGLGAHATTRDASKVFTDPGTYNVTLTVTYPGGTRTATVTITVHDVPSPAFTPSITSGCTPLAVSFTDNSTPGSGTISRIVWDFGDGNTAEGATSAHTYTVGGSFSVTTIVENSFGCRKSVTMPNVIRVDETPRVDFTADAPGSCITPHTVNFRSTGPGGLTYAWNFGDAASGGNNTSTAQFPSHTYNAEGRYSVTLTATTTLGCRSVVTKPAFILIERTRADFAVDGPACAGSNVTLRNTTTPAPSSSLWTLADGRTSNATNPSFFFAQPGTYNVTLTSGTPGCEETITKAITVHEPPQASFTANPQNGCAVPFTTQFTSQSIGAASYQWTFGDGQTSTAANPSHTYNAFGFYDVSLRVTSAQGCTDQVAITDYIRVEEPRAQLNISEREGCIPLATSFNVTLATAGSITSYRWDFGDGATSNLPTPSHTYTRQGIYTITVTLEISGGCRLVLTGAVRAGEIPVVDFDGTPKAPCADEPVHFTNLSVPRGTEWRWIFPEDNNREENAENPDHIFRRIGLHDVTLEVSNYGCRRSLTKVDFIRILPPVADFTFTRVCTDRYRVQFVDRSDFGPIMGTPRFWRWDFGDGNTSNVQSPAHVYAQTGEYTITLTVSDGNCESIMRLTLEVIDEKPVITSNESEICAGESVTISRNTLNENNIDRWEWLWGDGTYSPNGGNGISKEYRNPGTYNVVLRITDRNNCMSESNVLPIQVNGAIANFNASGLRCVNEDRLFTDASTSLHGYSITSWTWNFGDGTPEETVQTRPQDYQHIFSTRGTYDVRLSIVDAAGCRTEVTKPVTVIAVNANFNTATQIACQNLGIQFSNTSTGANLSYAWDFGDNTASTALHPVKVYTAPGKYTVKLNIADNEGCSSSIEKIEYITVPDPKADFTVPPTLNVCPPALVQLTNQSTEFVRSVWDFGDGSRSDLESPGHIYNLPGTYTIRLEVYSDGECPASLEKEIRIDGPIGTRTISPLTGCVPHDITLSASSANSVRYIWDLDNGTVQTTTTNSITYKYDRAGVYYPRVVLEDVQGCKVPAQGPRDSVIVDEVKVSFTLDDSQACDQAEILFNNTTTALSKDNHGDALTYAWDFGMTNRTDDVSGAENPRFLYDAVGAYTATLTATSRYGCTDTKTMPVKVSPKPDALIQPVTPICEGETALINGLENKNMPGTRWSWVVDNAPFNTGATALRLPFDQPGTHTVSLIIRNNEGTCPDTSTVNFNVNPLPVLNVTPRQAVVCEGDDLQLQTNASPAQFSWTDYNISDPASPSPRVSPVRDTTYRVTAVNSFGCIRSDSMRVTVSHPFEVRSANATICHGRQTVLSAAGAVRYRWIPATGLSDSDVANPVASPAQTTTYQVVGYGSDACFTDTTRVTVTVNPSPEVNTGGERIIPAGTSQVLNIAGSEDIISWSWFPEKFLNCYDCPSPEATPLTNVTYNISATNRFGCVTVALLPIKLFCNGSTAFIPNSFSPNGDGMNDIFYVRGKGISAVKSFRIFSRWGQQVFERNNCQSDDPSCGWDGRFGGALLNPDVYIYYVEVVCNGNEQMLLKGNITLLR
ncbi:PKD domain-containing protein [Chitinophaga sp. YIM B06452]|uniref:PKD domain-containing protein n=1 Tax=Chitinophaga sp. YIM B06452 TaxID=3082158 RepID=UPI0031FED656